MLADSIRTMLGVAAVACLVGTLVAAPLVLLSTLPSAARAVIRRDRPLLGVPAIRLGVAAVVAGVVAWTQLESLTTSETIGLTDILIYPE